MVMAPSGNVCLVEVVVELGSGLHVTVRGAPWDHDTAANSGSVHLGIPPTGGVTVVTGAAVVTADAAQTVAGLSEVLGVATLAADGALTSAALAEVLAAAGLTPQSVLTADGIAFAIVTGASSISLLSALTGTSLLEIPGQASVTTAGVLTAAGLAEVLGAASLTGVGSVTVVGDILVTIVTGAVSIDAGGSATISGLSEVLAAANLQGGGTLSATVYCIVPATLALDLASQLTAVASVFGSFGPPGNFTATAVDFDQIDLAWDSVLTAEGYDIERDGIIIVVLNLDTDYSDTGLNSGQEYVYRVRSAKERV